MTRHLRSPYGTALDLKSVGNDGVIEGYASLFHREDLGHDVILPGAFTDSLRKRTAAGIKLLYQHNAAEPIGVWDEIREDAKGLYVRGRLLTAVTRAREVLALMQGGAVDGLSIGFKMLSARRDVRTGIRHIAKVDLWEISVVTFPMLPDARASARKRTATLLASSSAAEFERWLIADGTLTSSEARALLADGLAGLHAHAAKATPLAAKIRAATARLAT